MCKSIVIKTIKSFDLKVQLSSYFDILVNVIKYLSSNKGEILFGGSAISPHLIDFDVPLLLFLSILKAFG